MDTICDHGSKEWAIPPPLMTASSRRPRAARSQKIRAAKESPAVDQSRLGTFPAPTPWSEQLAADNLQLACMMASRMAQATRMPFDDLYVVAAQGLLKGCRKYDPERINPATGGPYRLSTCVVPFIRGAMAQWLRDHGHSSGVKFPDRWRDKAPTVRRLAAAGATLTEVVEATGLPSVDVEAILQAQRTTLVLDPDAQAYASADPDPWDDSETYAELSEALAIADEAHDALRRPDQMMLEAAWESPRKRQLARLPHGQFMAEARAILRKDPGAPRRATERMERQSLALVPPDGPEPSAKRSGKRLTDPREILWVAEQLALGFNITDVGKTPSAGLGGKGAAPGNQPSNESGQLAELPSSGPG